MHSFYDNTELKKEIIDLYYKKLNELDIDYEFLTVETSFGDTNIIVTGKVNKPPLVLVHGENSCVPMAICKLKGLEDKFRIYAIDVLGQPNLSDDVRLSMKTDDYGKWMYEIMSRIQIHNAYLVGISLGGFISLKSLIYNEDRISQAFLINPAGIVKGNPFKIFIKSHLPLTLFKIRENTKCLKQYIKNTYSHEDAFTLKFLSKLFLTYNINSFSIPLVNKQELKALTTPLHIVVSKNDYLFPGIKLLNRAKQWLPTLCNVVLLQNAKHVPSQEDNNKIKELILESLITQKKKSHEI